MTDEHEILGWLQLSMVPGLGPVGASRLLKHFGSRDRLLGAKPDELVALGGIRRQVVEGFARMEEFRDLARRQLAAMAGFGGEVICRTDARYPELLREIADPPLVLWVYGNVELLAGSAVAVVGSRSATSYGRRVARHLAGQLSNSGICVVSGLALGIDTEAHQGALEGDGRTVAVLGCGLDVVYPSKNRELWGKIGSRGCLVSEYPLGTRPEGFRFPARNRIIAGLSRGVVVVEAARKSGSLITAQLALDFGREVFAVPGQIDSVKSEGAHWLLKQGARLVSSGEDILEELCYTDTTRSCTPGEESRTKIDDLDPEMADLLSRLEPYPMSRDEVMECTGIKPARLSELFLLLELEGHIEMLAGDLVRRLTE